MKCKDCNSMCKYRSSDAEKECFYSQFQHDALSTEIKTNEQIEMEKHWQDIRERAAIAIMAGIIANSDPRLEIATDANKLAKGVINFADALVKQLKGE